MSNVPNPASSIAASLESDPTVAAAYFLRKITTRWKLLVACTLLVPVVAVFLAYQLPSTYKASAQVLIRHQGGGNALYGDLIPSFGSISGASAAEIIRSDPITSLMIEKVGVQDGDIARPGYKVLLGKVVAIIMPLFGREAEDTRLVANPKIKYIILAKELKPSITTATLVMERSASSIDELVTVEIKSTDREKAALMVNGLCDAFIAAHNEQCVAEIRLAQKGVEQQTVLALAELTRSKNADAGPNEMASGSAPTAQAKSLSAGLAHSVAELEAKIAELGQTYTANSPEIIRARLQLAQVTELLAKQESIDASSDLLGSLQRKQRQLQIAADLFTQGEGDITVVERGLPARKSKLLLLIKYGVPIAAGLIAGLFFGCVAILALDAIDPYSRNAQEGASLLNLRLLGRLPKAVLAFPKPERFEDLPFPEARPGLTSILSEWEASAPQGFRVLAVTTAGDEAGASAAAVQLAGWLGRGKDHTVLLVDANFDAPTIGEAPDARGLLDFLTGRSTLTDVVRTTGLRLVQFVSAGTPKLRDEAGAAHEQWKKFLEEARTTYRTVIVIVGSATDSREAAGILREAAEILVVTVEGKTKRRALKKFAALLRQRQLSPLGVICTEAV